MHTYMNSQVKPVLQHEKAEIRSKTVGFSLQRVSDTHDVWWQATQREAQNIIREQQNTVSMLILSWVE